MSVWLCVPSARPVAEVNAVMDQWRERGYKIALWRDAIEAPMCTANLTMYGKYPGYSVAANRLASYIFEHQQSCNWVVFAGDDTLPDPRQADEIADELSAHFSGTFGVCQPTGDPWADYQGRIIERIAGSPWIGREFARRINAGMGPLWREYTHCFADEELQCVAQRLGVFLQRSDLTHMHHNWARKRAMAEDMPTFLIEANSPEHWAKYSALFRQRKAAGFPGSEPIA